MRLSRKGAVLAVTLLAAVVALVLATQSVGRIPPPGTPPPPPTPAAPVNQTAYPALTEGERALVVRAVEGDAAVRAILNRTNRWVIMEVGPVMDSKGNRTGLAVALVRLERPVWVEGNFGDCRTSYWARMWVGSLHVYVNLTSGKVACLDPGGPARPPEKAPLDDRLKAAEQVALNHRLARELGKPEAYLAAEYRRQHQELAVFELRSDRGWVLVAVDLRTMAVVDELSGMGAPTYPALTEGERALVVRAVEGDAAVRAILNRTNRWAILGILPVEGRRGLVMALVRLERPVWVEGNRCDGVGYRVDGWTAALNVYVNLTDGRVVCFEPWERARPPSKMPLDGKLKRAEEVALSHGMAMGLGRPEAYLAAVYYGLPNHPEGLAVFELRSDRGWVLVAVDLRTMAVVEDRGAP